jgi:hypothetical protein
VLPHNKDDWMNSGNFCIICIDVVKYIKEKQFTLRVLWINWFYAYCWRSVRGMVS